MMERIRELGHRLRAALVGTKHVRPARYAAPLYLAGVVAIVLLGFAGWARMADKPSAGPAMASALRVLPDHKLAFTRALDITWEREMRFADAPLRDRLNLATPELPPALCLPPGAGAEPDAEVHRRLTADLESALQRREDRPGEAHDALRKLFNAPVPAGELGRVLHAYNQARARLALGDTARAVQQLIPLFASDTSRTSRDSLAERWPEVAYNARILAGIAAYPANDSQAVVQFRGAVRTLQRLSPYGNDLQSTYHSFPISLAAYACGPGRDPNTGSMEAWVGLVAAYRGAESYRHPGLGRELRRQPGEEGATDRMVPLLSHARKVAEGAKSPIPVKDLWAASNLQLIYHYNSLDPDPRLELARAIMLLEVAADPEWTRAVAAHGRFDPCRATDGLTAEFGRGAGLNGGSAAATDSLRAAVALLANARLRACGGIPPRSIPTALRSEFILLGAGLLGDSVGPRAEMRRLTLIETTGHEPDGAMAALAQAQALERGTRRWRFLGGTRRDTTHQFLRSWREAVFSEVTDSVRARYTSDQLTADQASLLPDVMLTTARLSGQRPSVVYSAREVEQAVRRQGVPFSRLYYVRFASASYPEFLGLAMVLLVVLSTVIATSVHLTLWRSRMLLRTNFYLADARDDLPFGDDAD